MSSTEEKEIESEKIYTELYGQEKGQEKLLELLYTFLYSHRCSAIKEEHRLLFKITELKKKLNKE